MAGDRGALWWQFLRLIDEGCPEWVVGENVPGLLSSRDGQDFATIIDSLTECGYGVVWGVLDAQWFGVAQRRRRVFIVGHSGGRPRPEILALGEGMFGHPEPSRETGPVAAALTASGVGAGGGPDDNAAQANHLIPAVVGALQERMWKGPNAEGAADGHLIAFSSKDDGGDATENLSPTLRAGSHTDSHMNAGVSPAIVHATQDPIVNYDQAHALSANAYQAHVTSSQVRRLTPGECVKLQGFPDDFYDGIEMSDAQKYRQMGNAVAVPVAEWIMKRIAAYEPQEKP